MSGGLQRRRGSPIVSPFRCNIKGGILCVVFTLSCTILWFHAQLASLEVSFLDSIRPGSPTCTFREYPRRRYYELDAELPFLKDAEYIYGLPPIVLKGTNDLMPHMGKLCVNQSEYYSPNEIPFVDGTNPSLLSVDRLPSKYAVPDGATMLASVCVNNGLCTWKDSPQEKELYHISTLNNPKAVYTVLMFVNQQMQTISQATLTLELDAPWGRKMRKAQTNADGTFVKIPQAFDDARLFLHNEQVWISYREGPGFGYNKQVISPVHLILSDGQFEAYVKASETSSFSGGRNMALVSDGKPNTPLQSLTWADPVTMIGVNDGMHGRRLTPEQRVSHFHGTTAFLISWRGQYLGIGHFHRPPNRHESNYARHGHHYTHAFFAISANPPYKLQALSREFVFQSKTKQFDKPVADVIQFASGFEMARNNKVLIAYGINDCEAASIYVEEMLIEEMLIKVKDGQEVVDVMQKLKM